MDDQCTGLKNLSLCTTMLQYAWSCISQSVSISVIMYGYADACMVVDDFEFNAKGCFLLCLFLYPTLQLG